MPNYLALSRLIALKVPATANGLEMKVELTAVNDDNFENGLNLMNSDDFQIPLQLSSIPVGQILSVTKVVKKIFTGIQDNSVLESTFAGIISESATPEPIKRERLTNGYLIMVSNNDEANNIISEIDEKDLTVDVDGLKHKKSRLNLTNIIYSITFDSLKGIEENSNWFAKYKEAINKLDDLTFAEDKTAQEKILNDSKKLWIEGSALLYSDPTYIYKEQNSIKNLYFKTITDRYKELTREPSKELISNFIKSNKNELSYISIDNFKNNINLVEVEINKIAKSYVDNLGELNLNIPV